MDTEAIWQAIGAYGNARWRGRSHETDAADHLSDIKRLLKDAEDERAELVKAHDELLDKLKAKAELLRGCYAADNRQKQRIAELEKALTYIQGLARCDDWLDMPNILKTAEAALKEDKT